jgi:hypothetical protein
MIGGYDQGKEESNYPHATEAQRRRVNPERSTTELRREKEGGCEVCGRR